MHSGLEGGHGDIRHRDLERPPLRKALRASASAASRGPGPPQISSSIRMSAMQGRTPVPCCVSRSKGAMFTAREHTCRHRRNPIGVLQEGLL